MQKGYDQELYIEGVAEPIYTAWIGGKLRGNCPLCKPQGIERLPMIFEKGKGTCEKCGESRKIRKKEDESSLEKREPVKRGPEKKKAKPPKKGRPVKNPMLTAALAYHKRGWPVIPIRLIKNKTGGYDKVPQLTTWAKYQQNHPTEKEIKEWWTGDPRDGIALITGGVSGQIVLDSDNPESEALIRKKGIPLTCTCQTFKGKHYHLRHPVGHVGNWAGKGLDLRGDGGLAVLPPTPDPRGKPYSWIDGLSPEDTEIAPVPPWLLDLIKAKYKPINGKYIKMAENEISTLLEGVAEGQRHDTLTRLTGHYLGHGLGSMEVTRLLYSWNKANSPPLDKKEVDKVIGDLVQKKGAEKKEGEGKKLVAKIIDRSQTYEALTTKVFPPENPWLSKGLLPRYGFVLLGAEKGRGKTTLILQLCNRLMQGEGTFLLDFEVLDRPKRILYWYGEGTEQGLLKILETQSQGLGINLSKEQKQILTFLPRERLCILDNNHFAIMTELWQHFKPDLTIFDPIARFIGGENEINKLSTVNKLYDRLDGISKETLWLFIAHMRKPLAKDIKNPIYKIMGSSGFVNNPDAILAMDRADPHRTALCNTLYFELRTDRPLEPMDIGLNLDTRCFERISKGQIASKGIEPEDIVKYLKDDPEFKGKGSPGLFTKAAGLQFGLSQTRIFDLLAEASELGLVAKEKGKFGKWYAL